MKNKNIRINEVRYIDTSDTRNNGNIWKKNWRDIYNQEPIKDNERIRVFHGCGLRTAVTIAKQGLSGKEKQARRFSFENGMNPIGLFVSTSFDAAKEFASPFNGGETKNASVIIEFTANSNDLDTPVWNDSKVFFWQGSNPMPFKDRKERDTQKLRYQDNARNSEHDFIARSGNPAMAMNVFLNFEHQALFIGDLNPNMIKRFWVKKHDGTIATDRQYAPMGRKRFLEEYGDEKYYDEKRGNYGKIGKGDRLFQPNDDFISLEDLAERAYMRNTRKYPKVAKSEIERNFGGDERKYHDKTVSDFANNYKRYIENDNIRMFSRMLWPKQLMQMLGVKKYMEHFDRYGIGVKNQNDINEMKLNETIRECVRRAFEKYL